MWPGSIWAASAALLCGLAVNAEARPPEAPKLTAEEARARNLPPIAYKYKADPDAMPQLKQLTFTPCVGVLSRY